MLRLFDIIQNHSNNTSHINLGVPETLEPKFYWLEILIVAIIGNRHIHYVHSMAVVAQQIGPSLVRFSTEIIIYAQESVLEIKNVAKLESWRK